MTLFKEALKEGIEAAEQASIALKEVEEVFRQLDEEVMSESEGRLSIRKGRKTADDPAPDLVSMSDRLSQPIGLDAWRFKPKERYWAILASNPIVPDAKDRVLAIWSQDSAGYPCTVRWGGREHICEDKEALETCLADLLRDPLVGNTLARLMKAWPAEPTA